MWYINVMGAQEMQNGPFSSCYATACSLCFIWNISALVWFFHTRWE